MQNIFVWELSSWGLAVGSLIGLAIFGLQHYWMVAVLISDLLGVLIGKTLIYRIFRREFRESRAGTGAESSVATD